MIVGLRGFSMKIIVVAFSLSLSSIVHATSNDVQKSIAVEANGLGYSIVDFRMAGHLEGNSVYFNNKDGSVKRAFLKLSGSLGHDAYSDEVDANTLPSDNECEVPCASLENDAARKSMVCSGTCSYGAPYLLTAHENQIFLAIPTHAGRNAKFTAYSYSSRDKTLKIIGHFYAQVIEGAEFDSTSNALKVKVRDTVGTKSSETIKLQ